MISFIYRLARWSGEIDKTFAYSKIETDKYLVVSVSKAENDKNDKNTARQFAEQKLLRIMDLLTETKGKLLPKGKYFYRYLSHKELMELKKRVFFLNDCIRRVKEIVDISYKGVNYLENRQKRQELKESLKAKK